MSFPAIHTVFPREMLENLSLRQNISTELKAHLEILTTHWSCALNSSVRMKQKCNLAIKRAWEEYVRSAQEHCLLQTDNHELMRRLQELEGDNFRSAMSECIACWFFDTRLALPIVPRPPGRNGRILDMGVTIKGQKVGVEVKAPYRPIPAGAWTGDDSDLIESVLVQANKQFSDDHANVVTIVPRLRTRLFSDRTPLISAFLGREVLHFEIDKATGQAVTEPRTEVVLDGKFTKPIKKDHSPGYTRISAAVVIEESIKENTIKILGRYIVTSYRLLHQVLVLHNPFAKYTLPTDLFDRWPQLVRKDDYMVWTDNRGF